MSKVGCTVLLNQETSPLSPHFGKAKWVMVVDPLTGEMEFEQNHELNGRAIVEILVRHQCSDVIFAEIGPGALAHVQQAGIKAWFAPQGVAAPELMQKLKHGALRQATAPSPGHGHSHGEHHQSGGGCCDSSEHRSPCCGHSPEPTR